MLDPKLAEDDHKTKAPGLLFRALFDGPASLRHSGHPALKGLGGSKQKGWHGHSVTH